MRYARLVFALMATLAPFGVTAQTMSDIIRIDVLDGGRTDHGTQLAGLRLTLQPGWKTYWRSPGDAGIPPHFSWSGSSNLTSVAMTWPTPHAFDQSGMRSIGYTDTVVLPIEVSPAQSDAPIRLKGSVDLGICKDVCVPARLDFDQALSPDAPRNSVIVAALAARPYSASEAQVSGAVCRLTPTEDGLEVEARITMPSAGGTEIAVVESGNPMIWASEADTRRDGNVLTARAELIHADGKAFALDRSEMRLTVLGDSYAVDIRGCQPAKP